MTSGYLVSSTYLSANGQIATYQLQHNGQGTQLPFILVWRSAIFVIPIWISFSPPVFSVNVLEASLTAQTTVTVGALRAQKGPCEVIGFSCFRMFCGWKFLEVGDSHGFYPCFAFLFSDCSLNHSWLFQTQPQVSFSNVPTYVAGTDAFGAPASTMQMYIIKNGSLTWLGQQVRLTGNPCEMKCLWDIFRGREFDIYCLVTQFMIHTYHRYHRYHRCQIYIHMYIDTYICI